MDQFSHDRPCVVWIHVFQGKNDLQKLVLYDVVNFFLNKVSDDRSLETQVAELFLVDRLSQLLELAASYQILNLSLLLE